MRFKRYIKEATYKQDKFFRKLAVKAFGKAKKALDKAYAEYEKTGRVPLPYHADTQGWILSDFGYPDLIILLTHKKRYGGSGFTHKAGRNSRGEDIKALAMATLKGPDDFEYANTRFNKRDFIHEFVHYMDFKRGDTTQSTAELLRTKGERAYYNTPAEFNAYFQEGSQEVEDLFKHVHKAKPDKLKEILSDIEIFKTWVILKSSMFSKQWYENLEGKWKKKFYKRFYTLFKALRKKYEI